MRAGLLPPGVVAGVDLWRVAVMRPGDSPDGPFAALAAALWQREADLPPEEEGRGPALPEITDGDSKTPAELAAVLAHADAGAVRPITNALDSVAARAKDSERYGREVRCDLVLLIDQLDELLTALGAVAFLALVTKDYAKALCLSDEAIAVAPDQPWLYGNRAWRPDAARPR